MHPEFGPDLTVVVSVLQTALTPAFLLVAVGSLLNVLTGRLSRIVDRSRDLQQLHGVTEGPALGRALAETLAAALDGSSVGRDEQRVFALAAARNAGYRDIAIRR